MIQLLLAAAVPIVIGVIVLAGLIAFGLVSVTTSLLAAVGLTVAGAGIVMLLQSRAQAGGVLVAIGLVTFGVGYFTPFSIGDSLSFLGGVP